MKKKILLSLLIAFMVLCIIFLMQGRMPPPDDGDFSEDNSFEISGDSVEISDGLPSPGPSSTEYNNVICFDRQFFGNNETYGIFDFSMPVVGTPRVVVFVIDFLDNDPDEFIFSVSDIEKQFFDMSRINEPVEYHPADDVWVIDYYSVRDFFYRSSYGKLDITGDVIHYITQKPDNEYENWFDLMDEVMEIAGAEDALDWTLYDTSGTGYVDGVFFVLRGFPTGRVWFGDMALMGGHEMYVRDGIIIPQAAFVVGRGYFSAIYSMIHEAIHIMGLGDIRLGNNLNPRGTGASTILDSITQGLGDLHGIAKYIFGWIEPIHIDTTGETQVIFKSFSDYPQIAIIHPRGDKDNSNWFVVEYITSTNNNFHFGENVSIYPPLAPGGGLRIWRSSMNPEYYANPFDLHPPYIYLEAVHYHDRGDDIHGLWDHFFYSGDSFTPHTELNSNFPKSFYEDNGIKTMGNLSCSGIYIENIVIESGTASFTVKIHVD